MSFQSPCVTCPLREASFCGSLLGKPAGPDQSPSIILAPTFDGARPQETISHRGETVDGVYVLCQGWAYRMIQLPDGRRQILSFLLPGDLFSAHMIFGNESYFSVRALTAVRFARFEAAKVRRIVAETPTVLDTVAKLCTAENKEAVELLANLGRRNAEERIAYLMLAMTQRLIGQPAVLGQRFSFPLRQHHIADITGLTPVHVGRVITAFRKAEILEISGGTLYILNPSRLERIGRLG